MVGALGDGYLGLYIEIENTVGLLWGPNPGSGSGLALAHAASVRAPSVSDGGRGCPG